MLHEELDETAGKGNPKATHTPAPWVMDPRNQWDKEIRIEAQGDGYARMYCEVDYDDCDLDVAEANARLISASPDLLEAAVRMVGVFDRRDSATLSEALDAADALRAAIAKATGA